MDLYFSLWENSAVKQQQRESEKQDRTDSHEDNTTLYKSLLKRDITTR